MNLTVDLRTLVEQRETFNVIAETKRGDADNVIMLGSHLDSVVGGAGINDNASGTSTILTVAEEIASPKYKLDGKVRFAWWGAEETGLVGSTFYVNELAKTPGALQDIATYLNFDMLGSPNFQIGVYDADDSGDVNPDGVADPAGLDRDRVRLHRLLRLGGAAVERHRVQRPVGLPGVHQQRGRRRWPVLRR